MWRGALLDAPSGPQSPSRSVLPTHTFIYARDYIYFTNCDNTKKQLRGPRSPGAKTQPGPRWKTGAIVRAATLVKCCGVELRKLLKMDKEIAAAAPTMVEREAARADAAEAALEKQASATATAQGHPRRGAGEVGVDIVERRVRVSAEKQLLFQRAHLLLALVGRFHAHLVAAAPSAAASLAGAGADRWRGVGTDAARPAQ